MIKRYVIKVSHDHTGSFSLKAIVPDNASYDTVIFLFNKTIIIFFNAKNCGKRLYLL